MKTLFRALFAGLLVTALFHPVALAQPRTPPDLMIVLDGSGSMWGQIEGRTKIEIAQQTLSSVLGEANLEQNIGMMTYGHRVRGQCSDIELIVPLAPAKQSVPQIVIAANGLNPIGMTPLSDAVRQSADHLRFTERAATVVLITDGIETCEADPCALGSELARLGLDFRAHVVGFGMSEEEGAQVACLAEDTGGRFFLANDPDALADALSQTLNYDDDFVTDEPEIESDREVHLLLRDVEGGDLLRGAQTLSLQVSSDAVADVPDVFIPAPSVGSAYSGSTRLPAGDYELRADVASGNQRQAYSATIPFKVEAGDGPQIIDLVLGARLRIVPIISAEEPFQRGMPSATSGPPHLDFLLTPVIDGRPVSERAVRLDNMGTQLRDGGYEAAFHSGTWLVRGTLGRVFAREKLMVLSAGQTTTMVFDFEASRVFFDFDSGDTPVRSPTMYPSEGPDARTWVEARWRDGDGTLLPLFMPVGSWLLRGGDYHNEASRAHLIIDVTAPGQIIMLRPVAEDRVDGDEMGIFSHPSYAGCLERLGANQSGACLVEKVSF